VVSLPVQACILDRAPSAEVFWLVRPETAPILESLPGVSGVLCRPQDSDLERVLRDIKPDALLNLGHRDKRMVPAARRAGVPIRVARPRGLAQILCATHVLWTKRTGTGRHEAQNSLDFLKPFEWQIPARAPSPRLLLTPEEMVRGEADLREVPRPRLGVITRGSGGTAGAFPGKLWWEKMLGAAESAGWNPVALSPPDAGTLPPTDIRGLMGRLHACDAVLGVSTGPTHLAAALGVPTLCLMGKRVKHGPDRWMPLGDRVEAMQYPGREDDLGSGMDRLDIGSVLARLEKMGTTRLTFGVYGSERTLKED